MVFLVFAFRLGRACGEAAEFETGWLACEHLSNYISCDSSQKWNRSSHARGWSITVLLDLDSSVIDDYNTLLCYLEQFVAILLDKNGLYDVEEKPNAYRHFLENIESWWSDKRL